MEVGSALRVPDEAPLLAATNILVVVVARTFTPQGISNTAAVRLRLETEGAVVTETRSAVLPADRAYTIEAVSTQGVAKGTVLFLIRGTVCDDLTNTSAVGVLPAVGSD